MNLTVRVEGVPTTWPMFGALRLVWQSRVRPQESTPSSNHTWEIELSEKDGLWTGPSVGRNADGRRFLYFAWLDMHGRIVRRIKLYQNQVTGPTVTLQATMPDGTPACSTARLVE